ncbi:NfeD family protein [Microbacterium radiodurans]|uniref:NfeD family protein n=1 Tax=Microbacterium radiodurans TaxID=661398 RepID=A0A5J5IQQ0_9MICO|nr:NfeD family protein [Microbacterium radiodurans]KAA9086749.1 NfeD family protein [Microbacterium radiodurans]
MLPDLVQYLWIAWLVLALVFVIVELVTLEFTFLMLAAGTLIGGLGTNLLSAPWWLQVAAAAAVSALLLFTIRPLLLRALHRSSVAVRTNVDALAGIGGRAVAPFVDGAGSVKLDNGETWTARVAAGASSPVVGAPVVVLAVRGATVVVELADAARAAPGGASPHGESPLPDDKDSPHG